MRLNLDKALGTSNSGKALEKGRQELEAAVVASSPPVPRLPADPPLPRLSERPSVVTSEEAAQDLKDGVSVFAASTDLITNALFVTIGKLQTIARYIRFGVAFALLAVFFIVFALYRIDNLVAGLEKDREQALVFKDDLVQLKDDIRAARNEGQKTQEDVAAVRQASEEKPDISIVADSRTGQAKVVITTSAPEAVTVVPPPADPKPVNMSRPKPAAQQPHARPPMKKRKNSVTMELPLQLPQGSVVE